MEKLFTRSINEIGKLHKLSDEDHALFEIADNVADEILPEEYESYLERKFNSKTVGILKKHNFLGVPIEKEYGGRGADPVVSTLIYERLGQVGLGAWSINAVSIGLAGTCIQIWGDEEAKNRYLKPAAKGDIVMAYALTEPEAGSDPVSISTTFTETSDSYVLNGSKYLITNGSIADSTIVFAYPKDRKEGMSAFIVDNNLDGFSVGMELKEKLGFFTSDTALIELEDVEIPKENLLGMPGKGLWVAYTALISGRLSVGAGCIGVIEDCLNAVAERSKTRFQHGKPIGKHQLIQQHIAEITKNLEMCRWPTYSAAFKVLEWKKDPFNKEVRLSVDQSTAIAKRVASQLACDSADRAVQVFGGFGYSLLSPVGRHWLDTRATRIYEGTDEIMDLKIASGVLGRDFEAYK